MKKSNDYIGQKIREARKNKGITQEELGAALGYSPMGVSYFERGTRDIKVTDLEKISIFLQKPLSYFLPISDVNVGGAVLLRSDRDGSDSQEINESLNAFDNFLSSNNNENERA